jgi:hypothetical protein
MIGNLAKFEDRRTLERALRLWQVVFRMEDWEISVKYVSRASFCERERAGEADIDVQSRKALISIVDERDIAESEHPDWPLDRKLVLAHEFAHVLLWAVPIPDLPDNPLGHHMYEQTIQTLGTGISTMTDWESLQKKKK